MMSQHFVLSFPCKAFFLCFLEQKKYVHLPGMSSLDWNKARQLAFRKIITVTLFVFRPITIFFVEFRRAAVAQKRWKQNVSWIEKSICSRSHRDLWAKFVFVSWVFIQKKSFTYTFIFCFWVNLKYKEFGREQCLVTVNKL